MFSLRNTFVRNLIKNKTICGSRGSRINLKRNFCSAESPIRAGNMDKMIMSHYPSFVEEMKILVEKYDPFESGNHIERVMNYNASSGKKNRAKTVLAAFEEVASQTKRTEENLLLSVYLGWCLEVFHSRLLIVDDIMDGGKIRRGKPCWYTHKDIQMTAINDCLFLDAAMYGFLKKHFGHLQCYGDIVETFHNMLLIVTIGERMDLAVMQQDVLTYTMEQFRKIAIHKTADYSIYTPIKLAKLLAGKEDWECEGAKKILYEMGIFLQVQDDFLDCYGDPKVTGKIGTDIEDGKCTWLVVTFLNRADKAQKDILKESYGKEDAESVAKVKQIYNEVGLPEVYKNYEEETYKMLKKDIQEAEGIPKKMCQDLIDKFYRRKF